MTTRRSAKYTQWITIADLEARKYYFRTYDDTVMRTIDPATSRVSTVASPTHVEPTAVQPLGLQKAAVARIDLY
ncbi:linear amide C-N hydrolase [Burkholderia lata]|uniref:linear amide C-N hydrolase n=1 Tax=Burkholderia lata (strain ATCC 17760 / DSM 23089 / LMG 22485 / NCIMB 9086 / R18194 / 383) TaxID=482957 RepID=UPI001C2E7729|nr:linear amide C-N hydrolase [Burkholderia lata]